MLQRCRYHNALSGEKGGITEVAVGNFDKDNYDENELEQYVKDSIKEYEDNDGAGTVKLKIFP